VRDEIDVLERACFVRKTQDQTLNRRAIQIHYNIFKGSSHGYDSIGTEQEKIAVESGIWSRTYELYEKYWPYVAEHRPVIIDLFCRVYAPEYTIDNIGAFFPDLHGIYYHSPRDLRTLREDFIGSYYAFRYGGRINCHGKPQIAVSLVDIEEHGPGFTYKNTFRGNDGLDDISGNVALIDGFFYFIGFSKVTRTPHMIVCRNLSKHPSNFDAMVLRRMNNNEIISARVALISIEEFRHTRESAIAKIGYYQDDMLADGFGDNVNRYNIIDRINNNVKKRGKIALDIYGYGD
jgi:hypothetical protein